jgi:Tfp pilus assembly protein PilV
VAPPAQRRLRRAPASGFALAELLVAILVMTVGVLGSVSTAAVVVRLMGRGAQQTLAAHVAQSRFEWLRARSCAPIGGGSASIRGVRETWTMSPIEPTTYDVRDVVSYTTPDGIKLQTFRSIVRCAP